MAAQTPPDHVEPQKSQCGRAEMSIENPDFELNFEYADFEKKKPRQKCGRSLCGSNLFFEMKPIHKQRF